VSSRQEDEHTVIIPPVATEGRLHYDMGEHKLKKWKDGEWRNVKILYEDRMYIDPSLVVWATVALLILLFVGIGVVVGWWIT